MRIALINTPSLATGAVSRSMAGGLGFDGSAAMLLMPLDLAVLAATLEGCGETVLLVDADPLGLDAEGTHRRLDGATWDAIVATASLPSLDRDAEFIGELRRRHPEARVFAKTLVRDPAVLTALLERSGADLAIHGEVDLTIADIVHGRHRRGCAWLEPEEARSPAAISTPEPAAASGAASETSVVAGAAHRLRLDPGEPVADLDALPIAARHLLPLDRYVYPLLGSPVATLQTSRGCPYPCGFYCPYPLVEGTKWRAQSPLRIADELAEIVRLGIRKVYFRDATFTLDEKRALEICDRIVAAGWPLEWACETRVDCLSDELLERMRAAGCCHILIGVETGDEETMHLREGKRGLTMSKLERVRATTRRLGIRLHFLLIAGLPTDTRASILDTYDLIRRHRPDSIGVTTITPYPGTPLHAQAVREGWIDADDWRAFGGHQVPMHTPHLSRGELEVGKRLLEEAFEVTRLEAVQGGPEIADLATRHYRAAVQWAYRLEDAAAALHAGARAVLAARAASAAPPARAAQEDFVPRGVETPREVPVPQPVPSATDGAGPAATPAIGGSAPTATPAIGIVIPTRNRRDILRKTLLAYASQTVDADRFEVIVVDDGSEDDTLAMLERFRGCPVRVLRQDHRGANAARNSGIRESAAPVVLITGDDMIPAPNLVETHLRFHAENPDERDAMLGHIDWSPELEVTPFMAFVVAPAGGQQFAFHTIENGAASYRTFYSSNVSVKRSLLAREPLAFDEEFAEPAYDDTELGYRLARQGMRLRYEPRAIAHHHHPMDLASFARRQRSAGRMGVVFARKHPELRDALRVSEAERLGDGLRAELVDRAVAAATEAERPDRAALAALALDARQTFADYYVQTILHPLYRHALDIAYLRGLREGLEADRAAARAPTRHVAASAGVRFDASIVIPLFNKAELTQQCLEHLAAVTDGATYEVILVDNGSTDATSQLLQGLGGDVQVVRNAENLGFARACNQGAQLARGRYVVFLNNDTIPLPGWLSALVAEADSDPEIAVVGSKLLFADGTVQHAGVAWSRVVNMPYHFYRGMPGDAPCVNYRRELKVVTGACMLVRPEVFHAVGGFYEGYRNGFEDVDLCLKIDERGGRIVYQPKSALYHLESQTPGRKDHDAENAQRLRARWGAYWWLPDDDAIYVRDGFFCRAGRHDGEMKIVLEPLRTIAERARWELVAAAQDAARRQDLAALTAHLAEADSWPGDLLVLHWAAGLCEKVGAPELGRGFLQRMADGELRQRWSQDLAATPTQAPQAL